MSRNNGFHPECSEEFAELCALSVTNALTAQERQKIEHHIAGCDRCASLLAEYRSITTEGMAREAALRDAEDPEIIPTVSWDREHAKATLLTRIVAQNNRGPEEQPRFEIRKRSSVLTSLTFLHSRSLAAAAAIVVIVALTAYQVGFKRGIEHGSANALQENVESSLRRQLAQAEAKRAALGQKLSDDSKAVSELDERATKAERDLVQLHAAKAALESKAQDLTNQTQLQSTALAALAVERGALQQKLLDAEHTAQKAHQELTAAQDERQRALLRSASLENQVDRLSAQLHEREVAANRQDLYLASDRDIREMMGARQLYIADVFDVDSQGKTRKPFGRVFYTHGKSLIFYAFDLDKEPGYKEAKAFQAWGRPGPTQAAPVSLGVFYMDSEANRRWALKFDDPKILEEINAVFVTVEPQGGSKKPTNKPFLLAYLHTAPPNHP